VAPADLVSTACEHESCLAVTYARTALLSLLTHSFQVRAPDAGSSLSAGLGLGGNFFRILQTFERARSTVRAGERTTRDRNSDQLFV
jgi:hypothetical protein